MQEHDELDDILAEAQRILGGPPAPRTSPAQGRDGGSPWDDPNYAGTYNGPAASHIVRSAAARNRQAERFAVPDEPPEYDESPEDSPEEPRRKRHWFRNTVLALMVLVIIAVGLAFLLVKQPAASKDGLGERKMGVSTILVAGVDQDGMRTDTLLLLRVGAGTVGVVSIPRDTLVNGSYTVPKINGVYGVNGGGEEGTDMLLQRAGECIGFRPDGLLLVNMEGLAELVDAMGGVSFNVPQDMYYDDPEQDLHIALDAGVQTLDGRDAVGLVRFRSGYAEADLKRTEVQRDFLMAAAKQWVGPGMVLKVPTLLGWAEKYAETDMGKDNLLWLGKALIESGGHFETAILPGSAAYINGGSYYVLDPWAVPDVVNRYCNPYKRDVTVDDLYIRN